MRQHKKLAVYVVHQFAYAIVNEQKDVEEVEHKILGVYLDKQLAEDHRASIKVKTEYDYSANTPYIAVTKHTVRGNKSTLLGMFNAPNWKISHGNNVLFKSEDFS